MKYLILIMILVGCGKEVPPAVPQSIPEQPPVVETPVDPDPEVPVESPEWALKDTSYRARMPGLDDTVSIPFSTMEQDKNVDSTIILNVYPASSIVCWAKVQLHHHYKNVYKFWIRSVTSYLSNPECEKLLGIWEVTLIGNAWDDDPIFVRID